MTLQVQVVSPERILWSGEAAMVTARTCTLPERAGVTDRRNTTELIGGILVWVTSDCRVSALLAPAVQSVSVTSPVPALSVPACVPEPVAGSMLWYRLPSRST